MCRHKVCKQIKQKRMARKSNVFGGVASLILDVSDINNIHMLMGNELYGNKAGMYSICSGKMDEEDNGCCIRTLLRELNEEFGLKVKHKNLEKYFGGEFNQIRYFMFGPTPIFIGTFDDIDLERLNNNIASRLGDDKCKTEMKEMSDVMWFAIKDVISDDTEFDTTKYAQNVAKKFKIEML